LLLPCLICKFGGLLAKNRSFLCKMEGWGLRCRVGKRRSRLRCRQGSFGTSHGLLLGGLSHTRLRELHSSALGRVDGECTRTWDRDGPEQRWHSMNDLL
jgi:hypothetical protein